MGHPLPKVGQSFLLLFFWPLHSPVLIGSHQELGLGLFLGFHQQLVNIGLPVSNADDRALRTLLLQTHRCLPAGQPLVTLLLLDRQLITGLFPALAVRLARPALHID
jgi:hypothetical protein